MTSVPVATPRSVPVDGPRGCLSGRGASFTWRGASLALAAALSLAGLGNSGVARADEPDDKSAAIALFDQAQALMEKGDYAAACPKLVQSQHMAPALGTLLNLARCREGEGKIASAWAGYREVAVFAEKAGQAKRAKTAQDLAAALEPKLSRLRIEVGATPPGFTVRRDGEPVETALLGTAVAVDPGEHVIEASAPGLVGWSVKVTVGKEADLQVVSVPPLQPEPVAAAPTVTATAAPAIPAGPRVAPTSVTTAVLPPPPPPDGGRRTGFIVGGIGLGLLAVGGVFGAVAAADVGRIQRDPALCPEKACSDEGEAQLRTAVAEAWVSTIGIGLGVAMAGVGAILVLRAPAPAAPAARPSLPGAPSGKAPSSRGRGVAFEVGIAPSIGGGGVRLSGGF